MPIEMRDSSMIGLVAVEMCNSSIFGLIAVEMCNSDIFGLMVAEMVVKICNSGTIGLMAVEMCNLGIFGLMVAEICNFGMIELMVLEICNSGAIGLMVAEIFNSGTIGLMVAEISNSGTNGLMAVKICNSGTIGLMGWGLAIRITWLWPTRVLRARVLAHVICTCTDLHLSLGLTRQPIRADMVDSRCRSAFIDIVGSQAEFSLCLGHANSQMSSSGSSNVMVVPSASSEGTQSKGSEASVSGSLYSGISSPVDAKSLRDLEVMKSCHDVDSVTKEESLGSIWECYSILEEYALQAPLPEQRPYNPESSEISITVDALEAGLCFPLHPTIVECLRWWRISPSQMVPNSCLLRSSVSALLFDCSDWLQG
ncbi:hypothetical protein BHE74_00039403 [Ensete ventricosum]|nr:hypothetical protein BHE74_00039403 [Ensete ventricosum]